MPFFHRYKNLLPLMVLTGFAINTIAVSYSLRAEGYELRFTAAHYTGFASLLLCWLSWFFLRKYFKHILSITLLAGIFNFACFTPSITSYYLSINGTRVISLQPLSAGVAVLFILLNLEFSRNKDEIDTEPIEKPISQEKLDDFRKKYETLSHEELKEICQDQRYVPEARQAAQNLLRERTSS